MPWLRYHSSPPAGLRRSPPLAPEVRHLCGKETTPQTCDHDPARSALLAVVVVARVLDLCARTRALALWRAAVPVVPLKPRPAEQSTRVDLAPLVVGLHVDHGADEADQGTRVHAVLPTHKSNAARGADSSTAGPWLIGLS